jgi:transposase
MARVCQAAAHLSVDDIDARIRQATEGWRMRRWLILRHALLDPQPAAAIAAHLGVAPQTVRNLLWRYKRWGPEGIDTPGRGQRQRAYLSLGREQAIVGQFVQKSVKGQVSTGLMMKAALEKAVGHKVAKTTVYRMLKRHQWRKVVPRPGPPEEIREQQAVFKKTSATRLLRSSRREPHTIRARS